MHPGTVLAGFLSQAALKRAPRRLIVAVSGGADSVALLRAAHAAAPDLGWRVYALHCDHGLRGRASRSDAAFVRKLCGSLGIPLNVQTAALKRGAGVEERARVWRRRCYVSAAKQKGAGLVLLGHHAQDQAETVLLNLARGAGLSGAAGMLALSPVEGAPGLLLGRPFLGLLPQDLRAWLKRLRQAWREDASNRDLDLARNRVRSKVLYDLGRINPRAVEHVAAFAASLSAHKDAKDVAALLKLDAGARKRAAAALAKGVGSADLGRGWVLDLSAGKARLRATRQGAKLSLGTTRWNDWRFELKLAVPTARKLVESGAYWFSPALLKSGARVRPLRPGDRLKPFGFEGRHKAADLLREAGVPVWARDGWPVLEAQGRILALPGVRRGQAFQAKSGAKALRLGWGKAGMDKLPHQ